MAKTPVAVLGATGAVGQRFIQLLADHPWFEVAEVAASDRSAGKTYAEACTWRLPGAPPPAVAALTVKGLNEHVHVQAPLLRPRLLGGRRGRGSPGREGPRGGLQLAQPPHGPRRAAADPGDQRRPPRRARGSAQAHGRRYIVTNPNCSVVGLAMALAPLERAFGITEVVVVTLQALSGAGYPGVASLDVADNVVPYIGGGEEEKIEIRAPKILGTFKDGAFQTPPSRSPPRSTASRSPTATPWPSSCGSRSGPPRPKPRAPSPAFRGEPQERELPTAPRASHPRADRERPAAAPPRPRPGRRHGRFGGPRARRRLFDLKLEALVHNTIRGAAGAAILNAELLQARGLLP